MVGMPVALTLAVSGFVFGWLGFGPMLFSLLPHRIFGVVTSTPARHPALRVHGRGAGEVPPGRGPDGGGGAALGALRGGLGLGIVFVGVLMGATTGIVGATVVTLGLLTLPALLRRGYDKGLACGVICASGTLGQIIPPSLILILLADIMNLSVGTLFAAAGLPGLMLAGIYCAYILVLGIVRPGDGAGGAGRGTRADLDRQLLVKLFR
jgi:TRAP-type mannitol/chloroaromatic compound transport system permease large subunit